MGAEQVRTIYKQQKQLVALYVWGGRRGDAELLLLAALARVAVGERDALIEQVGRAMPVPHMPCASAIPTLLSEVSVTERDALAVSLAFKVRLS